jgi:ATP-binding cassette subfamily C protein
MRPGFLALIAAGAHQRSAALLGMLAFVAALTEGLGLVVLVPLLEALGGAAPRFGWINPGLGIGGMLGLIVILVFIRALLGHWRQLAAVRLRAEVVDGLRQRGWHALLHAEWRALREARRSDSASLLISDIDRIGSALGEAFTALALAATLLAVVAAGMLIAPFAMLAGGVIALMLLPLLHRRRVEAATYGEQVGVAYSAIHAASGEALSGLRAIKSLNAESAIAARLGRAQTQLRTAEQGYWRIQGYGQILLQGAAAIALALYVWLSVTRFGSGPAELVPLVAIIARAVPLLGAIQASWLQWAHTRPALVSFEQLIAPLEKAREPFATAANPIEFHREIRLEDIAETFDSATSAVLSEIDFTLSKGQVVAIDGPSGAGKSTLADLLGGLLGPSHGTIAIDGHILDASARRVWRGKVGYVTQESLIFAGSVRDNLRLAAPEASEAALRAALRDAAADFVSDLPGGLDCRIGDGGRSLSGGEQQRIALARILLREPQLLILDEATSALDTANELQIADAIERLRGRMTIVIIGHRGGLLDLAERVVTLERGRIAKIAPGRRALPKIRKFTDYSASES